MQTLNSFSSGHGGVPRQYISTNIFRVFHLAANTNWQEGRQGWLVSHGSPCSVHTLVDSALMPLEMAVSEPTNVRRMENLFPYTTYISYLITSQNTTCLL
jgi:hypothetical protein